MLVADRIREFPEGLNLMKWARDEYDNAGERGRTALVRTSEFVWAIKNQQGETLMVIGVFSQTLIGETPELYILLCEGFRVNIRRNLRECKHLLDKLLQEYYPKVLVHVDAQFPSGQRFAEFMGFVKQDVPPVIRKGREYLTYEVSNGR